MSRKLTISTEDTYNAYIKKKIGEGLKYSHAKKKKILSIENKEYMTYKLYKEVISLFSTLAGEKLIKGYSIDISPLGNIYIARIKRNFNKPRLNRPESFKLRKELKVSGELTKENWRIYYTDDEFIKLMWHQTSATRNIIFYQFKPAGGQPGKGFRSTMSREINSNPNLKALYPYIDNNKKAA